MFVRIVSGAALLSAASLPPTIALAAAAAAATSGVCSKLSAEYDQTEKGMAMTDAEGVGDDSAVRETNRQIESSNFISRAGIMVTLMEAHHCALPDHAPSPVRYLSAALSCATDRLKSGVDAPACKMETWQPMK